jgi:hypothetical protein
MAHGIEPAAERIAAGKPPIGTISLAARQEGDAVFLEVGDDGAGIDPGQVRASLIGAGRLEPEAAAAASDEQIVAAIFEAGVSTRDAADELAGRGVGLDVVRENIARLGGDITVASTPGAGTRFTVRLPLTTAISQAFLFKVAGQVYALPNVHIVDTDGDMPVVSLHKVLGVEATAPGDGRKLPVIGLEFAGRRLAATCDKLIGPREIVVKSLGPLLAPIGLFAGGTISGAGKVQLILDPAALVELAYPAAARPVPVRGDRRAGRRRAAPAHPGRRRLAHGARGAVAHARRRGLRRRSRHRRSRGLGDASPGALRPAGHRSRDAASLGRGAHRAGARGERRSGAPAGAGDLVARRPAPRPRRRRRRRRFPGEAGDAGGADEASGAVAGATAVSGRRNGLRATGYGLRATGIFRIRKWPVACSLWPVARSRFLLRSGS